MLCQNGGRHAADAAGNRGNAPYKRLYLIETYISADRSVRSGIDADIDHDLIGICKGAVYDTGLTGCNNKDFRFLADFRHVHGFGMAHRYSRVAGLQHHSYGFADYQTSSDHGNMLSGGIHTIKVK